MIRIVNWILTRKCNLKCDYCAIVKDPHESTGYPQMSHYYKNEMSTTQVIDGLAALKRHNPNAFHLFYGGEPLLRKDLPQIVNYCNEQQIHYTIISNNTPEIQPMIKKLFQETDYVEGFTSSVDPVFNQLFTGGSKRDKKHLKFSDRIAKSIVGLKRLKEIQSKGLVKDVVAEITVMNHNQHFLYDLVRELSDYEIYSDITFVDIAKTSFYDFSNITDRSQLVNPTFALASTFKNMLDDSSLLIHMKDVLLPMMFDTLPSEFDCGIEKNIHNITIDADGSLRLCLRICGEMTPRMCNVTDFDLFGNEEDPTQISAWLTHSIIFDKKRYCRRCNHSCLMMSKFIDESDNGVDDLIHSDKRKE